MHCAKIILYKIWKYYNAFLKKKNVLDFTYNCEMREFEAVSVQAA